MLRSRWATVAIFVALGVGSLGLATPAHAADDTARFYGPWEITFPYNGRTLTLVSVHDASGFKNYILLPDGSMPVGEGKFSAVNGRRTAAAAKPSDSGTYQFLDNNDVTCTNATGQAVTWKRHTAPLPPVIGTGAMYPKNINATMASAVAAARKLWMKDAVMNGVELQWYPPNVLDSLKAYWLKLSIISPSIRVQCSVNVGGPLNGGTICSPPEQGSIERLQHPLPATVSLDLPDALAYVRRLGMGGPLGSVKLRMAGATGTPEFPAWVIEVAGGPAWVPLFVNAQNSKVIAWQQAMDPPNGSDAQLADIYGRLLHRNQLSGSQEDPGYRAMECVVEIQETGNCVQ